MCTVVLRLQPGRLEGLLVRDELLDRPTAPSGPWWPELPGVVGARDLEAGGTAAALDLSGARFAAVLNGRGEAPAPPLLTRGRLPLDALLGRSRRPADRARTAPYHLLLAHVGQVTLESWHDAELSRSTVTLGDHVVVNEGMDVAGVAKSDEVAAALAVTPTGSGSAWTDWSEVIRAALVEPVEVNGHRYGTRSLTRVLLVDGRLAAEEAATLDPATAWSPLSLPRPSRP